MKTITLARGQVALVDDEDYELVAGYKWWASSYGYAIGYPRGRSTAPKVLMHRLLLNAQSGAVVDHADGDRLNNQRANLRFASAHQNQANRRPKIGGRTRFKGIFPQPRSYHWGARIHVHRRQIHIGTFPTEEEAARAYDRAALHYFGEFAVLNFPHDPALIALKARRKGMPSPPPIPADRVREIAREEIDQQADPCVSAMLHCLAAWMDEVVPPDDETGEERSRPRLKLEE